MMRNAVIRSLTRRSKELLAELEFMESDLNAYRIERPELYAELYSRYADSMALYGELVHVIEALRIKKI